MALRTRSLTKVFRGFRAVDSVDLEVREGSVHALVGPNGAGKTTLFNLLTGFVSPTSGAITVFDEDVTGQQPEQVARRGVARSFQITSLFETLTSRQHVELALQGLTSQGFRFWRSEKLLGRNRARVDELLAQVGLMPLAEKPVGLLAYGQKRALELALVLALDPRVMLLDEPTAGMGIEDVDRTIELVRRLAAGRTVVFVDHNMHVVGSLADRVTVLQQGRILAEGGYDEVRNDERVITAYLGEADHA
ncbi:MULTISPECIES: ABC transporter ATP-binding protein [unclassified Plantactinospora]|uniref:ABC transporter ATP-binding protein n=1 Tax=unclassified Plantactinospora TaxID=2631981 RepID=UPI000D16320A|nr:MULTISPECIES: ABC transporter ATP-binding protein [unclassified Plantactinospora]AVT28423.1 ABC transporter ATP-binding protein [Plantactinospora sp. BC1]AVT38340.1 ABC transporter ATP-binding protein [Plantactinospora sp. BB1]